MAFQEDPNIIKWRLHLKSPPQKVYDLIATNEGRAQFWAETAVEEDGHILFTFPNGWEWRGEILDRRPPSHFSVNYFGSRTSFDLAEDGADGTDLTLIDAGVQPEYRIQVIAGWVSVLMALKGAVDYGVDLRNHDSQRTWELGYCDN